MGYTDVNARLIDEWIADGWKWGQPISHEAYERATTGSWSLLLTPTIPVPRDWLPEQIKGLDVLGLAAGGGQQMPVFAAQGAHVTVLDYSPQQVASELMVAEREGYEVNAVRADMTQRLPFEDAGFDLVFHPISNVYVEDVRHIWDEVVRVLRPGGRLLAGLDNGFNYVVDDKEERIVNRLPFNPLRDPEQRDHVERDGYQFSHTLDEQVRGQLQAGLRLVDCYEDTNGIGRLHELGIPTCWATYAVKPS